MYQSFKKTEINKEVRRKRGRKNRRKKQKAINWKTNIQQRRVPKGQ